MFWIALSISDPKRIYNQQIHSSVNLHFYICWLVKQIEKRGTHPKTAKRIEKEHGKWFISWSPYIEKNIEEQTLQLVDILIQLVFFWLLKEIHIQFIKYVEESDSTECDKEFIINKESDFKDIDTTVWRYFRQNMKDLMTTDYFIKIDEKKLATYQHDYLENCINDDIEDNRILLYSFEKQLNEVRTDMIYKRNSFWKRKFEISSQYRTNINLFTVLYYLESKWLAKIENIDSKILYFNGQIPESFIISITAPWMDYLDEFDYMKKLSNMTHDVSKNDGKQTVKNMVYFDEKLNELVIDGYKKKLSQKQIIFIDALFDLKDKWEDWWVSLEEIAVYDDHSFEEKFRGWEGKNNQNFYNIGNHLNKSIKLETEFEKVLEITTKEVRINPKFAS
jgi:hypothetical protein